VKEVEVGRACSTRGGEEEAYGALVEKSEGERPLRRTRRRREDNIKINLREMEWSGVDWIYLTQDRDQWRDLVNTVMNLWVP
jgi:hypothetical protein